MKKPLVILLALILALGLSSCGCSKAGDPDASPGETAAAFLEAVKKTDTASLAKVYSGDASQLDQTASQLEQLNLPENFGETLQAKLTDFNYKILEEKIDGDKALVEIEIQCYDVGKATKEFLNETPKKLNELIGTGAKEDELSKAMLKLFSDKIGGADERIESTAQLALSRVDGIWKVDDIKDNQNIMNAFSGNMIEGL